MSVLLFATILWIGPELADIRLVDEKGSGVPAFASFETDGEEVSEVAAGEANDSEDGEAVSFVVAELGEAALDSAFIC